MREAPRTWASQEVPASGGCRPRREAERVQRRRRVDGIHRNIDLIGTKAQQQSNSGGDDVPLPCVKHRGAHCLSAMPLPPLPSGEHWIIGFLAAPLRLFPSSAYSLPFFDEIGFCRAPMTSVGERASHRGGEMRVSLVEFRGEMGSRCCSPSALARVK